MALVVLILSLFPRIFIIHYVTPLHVDTAFSPGHKVCILKRGLLGSTWEISMRRMSFKFKCHTKPIHSGELRNRVRKVEERTSGTRLTSSKQRCETLVKRVRGPSMPIPACVSRNPHGQRGLTTSLADSRLEVFGFFNQVCKKRTWRCPTKCAAATPLLRLLRSSSNKLIRLKLHVSMASVSMFNALPQPSHMGPLQ